MKSQNETSSQHSLTYLDNLIGLFIMVIEWIFFISAPVAGMILVVPMLTIILFLGFVLRPAADIALALLAALLGVSIYSIPLGLLLGFYMFMKVNKKMTQGRQQRNIALGVKSGVGIFSLASILCIAVAFKTEGFDLYVILLGIYVLSLIFSLFVHRFIYRYLEQLDV